MTNLCLHVAVMACLAVGPGAAAGEGRIPEFERDGPVLSVSAESGDSCLFFRGQAYGHGVYDFAAEMLAACEVIASRRATGWPLTDRLIATEAMLNDYRQALIAAGAQAFARKRRTGETPWSLGLSNEEKYAIADATGALLALEAIRRGF